MRPENTLRRRLVSACILLALVIGGVFAAAAYGIIEAMEYELIEKRLYKALPEAVDGSPKSGTYPASTGVRVIYDTRTDPQLRGLDAGLHEVERDGRVLNVLVVKQGNQHNAVIEELTDYERVEFIATVGLWTAFLAGVLLAVAIARSCANRVIAPLTTLSEAVQRDELPAHPQLLAAADEIGVLARAFDVRTAQLRDSLVRERLFTADVSHELRTPLTVILGAAELLAARAADRPDLREVAERIRRTAADTSVRVSALLQLGRSPEKLERQKVALRPIVEQEIEYCLPMLRGKPVVLAFESTQEVWVHGARDLAAIAVGNLLRNACQFTEHGSVRVTLTPEAFAVEDTGPGVPQAVRSRLFERFVRGPDESLPGAGLGLSIVKRVAGHLGWTVSLDDPAQGGSRFTLIFASAPAL